MENSSPAIPVTMLSTSLRGTPASLRQAFTASKVSSRREASDLTPNFPCPIPMIATFLILLSSLSNHRAGDRIFLNLFRPLIDLSDSCISVKTLYFILGHITVAPENLNCFLGYFNGHSPGNHLGHGGPFG